MLRRLLVRRGSVGFFRALGAGPAWLIHARSARASIGLLLALCAAPSVALGQGGASDEDRARSHFETGAVLYADENYEGALAAFEESYRLRAVPVVLFNIAQTLRRLNRYGEAIESYERYLREEPDLPADRRSAVRSTIGELRRALAPITVDTDIEGVTIEVDGRVVGTTPLPAPLELAAGVRTIVARRDGYVAVREELRVVGGQPQELSLRMPQAETAGTLTVQSNVDGALVRIDGVEVGVAPASRRLGQGGHSVEVEADGYDVFRQEVVLAARQQRVLFAELEVGREVYEEWWFWTVVGAVVLGAVAVGVVVAVNAGQADPIPGSLGTVAALR